MKQTKKYKKNILQKAILIYNRSKIYIDKERFIRDTILYKYDCLFDIIAFVKDNIWVLQVQKSRYNYEFTLSNTYLIYNKTVIT